MDSNKDLFGNTSTIKQPPQQEVDPFSQAILGAGLRREVDSLDDFEHLGHDSSPLKDLAAEGHQNVVFDQNLLKQGGGGGTGDLTATPPRDDYPWGAGGGVGIDKGDLLPPVASVGGGAIAITTTDLDELSAASFDPLQQFQQKRSNSPPQSLFDTTTTTEKISDKKMDSNLLQQMGGDHFPDRKEADAKLDKFLQEMSTFAPPPQPAANKHDESPEFKGKLLDDFKSATQNFMDTERGPAAAAPPAQPVTVTLEPSKKPPSPSPAVITAPGFDQLERYSDSEPDDEEEEEEEDEFQPSKEDFLSKKGGAGEELPAESVNKKNEATFKDVKEFHQQQPSAAAVVDPPSPVELPQKVQPQVEPEKVGPSAPPAVAKPASLPEPLTKEKTPSPPPKAQPVLGGTDRTSSSEVLPEEPPKVPMRSACVIKPKPDSQRPPARIDAEAIFCKMGLDAWFNPERLNPRVESLIYWRDPKKSGPVFGGVLLVLLALTYFSLISVVAYASLLALTGTISFRIYKNIVQAVQKTGDGHPFKDLLEYDVSLPQDKVKEVSEVAVAHINAGVGELRRLFLVEDLVDSIKFGVLLWTLTYLGAWFNGMTLIIIAWVALFTLPKVYEANKTQIDANLEIVRSKLAEITSKVKAAIPIGKKAEEKKEQ